MSTSLYVVPQEMIDILYKHVFLNYIETTVEVGFGTEDEA